MSPIGLLVRQSVACRFAAVIFVLLLGAVVPACAKTDAFKGPLRICQANQRYFADDRGLAIYLTGSHTWSNLVDMGPGDSPAAFDYDGYLKWMAGHGHNFIRLWAWETVSWNTKANTESKLHVVSPQPWTRTGPGKSLDGKPKLDLAKFNDAYFKRLRRRVESAGDRGIYVSIMLFEGWAMQFSEGAWRGHPFNKANNVNGIDGDANGDGNGLEVHEMVGAEVRAIQEAYVRKVIDTVNDLDNVLYEISNENHPESTQWQYHMIRFIKRCEKTMKKQHPVGMTFQYKAGSNETLFKSPADWISPNNQGGYRDNPPAGDGRKVVINDTDHLWGIGGDAAWVWKTFTRGHNAIFMDPYDGIVLGGAFEERFEPLRKAMGYTLSYAQRMDLTNTSPRSDLSSTRYCLANEGAEYLVYNPDAKKRSIELTLKPGNYSCEWFNPATGKVVNNSDIQAKPGKMTFTAPFDGHSVLYVKKK